MKKTLTACLLVCVSPGVFGCDVIGVLDGLALAGSRVSQVDVKQSWIERKDDKGKMGTKPVTNGMPLCRDDRLAGFRSRDLSPFFAKKGSDPIKSGKGV